MDIVMKTKWILLLAVLAMMAGCDTEVENIVIQKPNEYSEQYFADLRAWKLTEHEVTYAYFASYTNAKANVKVFFHDRRLSDYQVKCLMLQ